MIWLFEHISDVLVNRAVMSIVGLISVAAMFRIVRQAGYRGRWVALPAAAVIIWIILLLWSTLGRGSLFSSGFDTVGSQDEADLFLDLYNIDWLLTFAAWGFFVVFAIREWPVTISRREFARLERQASRQARTASTPAPPLAGYSAGAAPTISPTLEPPTTPATTVPPPVVGAPASTAEPPPLATEGPRPSPPIAPASATPAAPLVPPLTAKAPAVATVFCTRCGEEINANGAYFHECSRSRPQSRFCAACGTEQPKDATSCATCSAPL